VRLSNLGAAATGYSTVGVNGASILASAGSFYGPAWLTNAKIAYQNFSATAIEQSYDIGTTATATLASQGSTIIAAGNSIWAYYIAGGGVFTSNGVGPFPNGFLGEVSTDHGEIINVTSSGSLGLTVYDSSAATLLSLPAVALVSPYNSPCRLRGHVLAYRQTSGWTLVNVNGDSISYRLRTDDVINWITPVFIGTTLYLLERSNRLTLRPATQASGWLIQDVGNATFNPDAVSLSSAGVRMGWCTNAGETPASLVIGDLVVATNTLTLSIVVASALVPQTPQVLTPTTFAVGPLMGGSSGNVPMPRSDHPIVDKDGKYTRAMSAWMLGVNGTATNAQAVAQSASNQPSNNDFGVIASGSNVPITASIGQDTLTITPTDRISVALDPVTKTATLGLGGETTITSTGTQNNVSFSGAATLRCNNASALTLTGLAGGVAGQRLIIAAINSTVAITNNGGTPASSGFLTTDGGTVTLTAPDQMLVERDATSSRWREVRRAVSGTGTVTTTGSPASGNLAKFSSGTAITNADLAGDVTTSGTATTTIAANVVTTTKIINSAVTLAKIANAAANSKLLGSGSAGSGSAYAELTPNLNLAIASTNVNVSIPLTDDGNSSTALTLDFGSAPRSAHKFTLTGNVTLTFNNPLDGGCYVLKIATGAGGFSVTWPGTVLWPSGTAPTITATASKVDLVTLLYDATATKYYGSFNQNY
jgi:hypothetical protein